MARFEITVEQSETIVAIMENAEGHLQTVTAIRDAAVNKLNSHITAEDTNDAIAKLATFRYYADRLVAASKRVMGEVMRVRNGAGAEVILALPDMIHAYRMMRQIEDVYCSLIGDRGDALAHTRTPDTA